MPDTQPHYHPCPPCPPNEDMRIEAVTTYVGFDDILDVTLARNHGQVDTFIVVTSHDDRKTQMVARKHSAICVESDLFTKNGRNFNKGAAINQGMSHFQYHGWRMHLDVDIVLADSFRRVLFNHTALDTQCIYGCDRIDVIGEQELQKIALQHRFRFLMYSSIRRPIGARFISSLYGYVPIGFFQMWHATQQRDYPYSLGNACHDDVLFAAQWPELNRRVLPSSVCYHLRPNHSGKWGENWNGRTQARLKGR